MTVFFVLFASWYVPVLRYWNPPGTITILVVVRGARQKHSCVRVSGVSARFPGAFCLRKDPCSIRELEATRIRVNLIDTRYGRIPSFGVSFVHGGAGGGRACRAPAKE